MRGKRRKRFGQRNFVSEKSPQEGVKIPGPSRKDPGERAERWRARKTGGF